MYQAYKTHPSNETTYTAHLPSLQNPPLKNETAALLTDQRFFFVCLSQVLISPTVLSGWAEQEESVEELEADASHGEVSGSRPLYPHM